jgi:hypothetical protein
MRIDDPELERILASQPRWNPPSEFVARTVGAAAIATQEWSHAERGRRSWLLPVVVNGVAVASVSYAGAALLLWMMPAAMTGFRAAIDGYWDLIELAPSLFVARAATVAWVSSALSLSLATSIVLRTRG